MAKMSKSGSGYYRKEFTEAELIMRSEVAQNLRFSGLKAHAGRLEECGTPKKRFCLSCNKSETYLVSCHSPLCSICAHKKSASLQRRFKKRFKDSQTIPGFGLKFITLPIKTDGDCEKAMNIMNYALPKLYKNLLLYSEQESGFRGSYQKGKKTGKKVLTGLITACEFGPDNGNLHAHCVYYGPYIPQKKLSEEWERLTGSKIVDIRKMDKNGWKEVMKYITDINKVDPEMLTDCYLSLVTKNNETGRVSSKRRVKTYGIFYGFDFKLEEEKDFDVPCQSCGSTAGWLSESEVKWRFQEMAYG